MSFLAWIDFDQADRDRTRRIMDLFGQEDSRDELGLGSVRDALADLMFPGTSTIQTRLRYMLFVPWIYQIAGEHAGTAALRQELARGLEFRLIEALINGDETQNVIGREARETLKRLPSDVYWAGLYTLGIRKFHGSRDACLEASPGEARSPPSLPYFGERVTTSKLLIFSQWAMVPDAIAALLSYDSERAMGMDQLGHQYSDAFRKQTQPLNFRKTKGRLTGLRALTLIIPSPTLAKAVDPLPIFRSGEPVLDAAAMRALARKQLVPLAKVIGKKIRSPERGELFQKLADGLGEESSGTRAETWEWACAASLDQDYGLFGSWLSAGSILSDEIREDGLENWLEHISALNEASNAEHLWGHPEFDRLLDHLTDLALGSPATCALRALHRIAPDLSYDDPRLLNAATRVGMAFRGLFNQPESQALLRGESDDFYWQSVLHHCVNNDLQSVLDEYVHVLLEAEGQTDASQSDAVTVVSKAIDEALSLKPARIEIKRYQARRGRIHTLKPFGMRGRFATRLIAKGQEDNAAQRTDTIRTAFNSPFRPFVLASTSVGQEGLDFHLYCHRLVHWNLPSNPVDLEQREGRIHRYKNHAIRQNLAQRYSQSLKKVDQGQDIWAQMFDIAEKHTEREGGLEPYWLLEGQTSIERYALSLPYSRETSLMGWLRRSVAIYRLAFGQPRQDDLLTFLSNLKGSTEEIDMQSLQINLRP